MLIIYLAIFVTCIVLIIKILTRKWTIKYQASLSKGHHYPSMMRKRNHNKINIIV